MHPKPGTRTAMSAVPAEVSALPGQPQLGPAPELTRPLGTKTAALHQRRLQAATLKSAKQATAHVAAPQGPWVLSSEDGALSFTLQAMATGLCIERTQRRPLDAHLIQVLLFESLSDFLVWCEADTVRFDHPLLYQRLRRQGDEQLRRLG